MKKLLLILLSLTLCACQAPAKNTVSTSKKACDVTSEEETCNAKDDTKTKFSEISFDEAISKRLEVMDATAFALCRDQKLPIKVFSINKSGALERVIRGEDEGTLVHV